MHVLVHNAEETGACGGGGCGAAPGGSGGGKGLGGCGGGGEGGGGEGDDGGGDGLAGGWSGRTPQSKQSVPREQYWANSAPGPPSSQSRSCAQLHVLVQSPGTLGGGRGGEGGLGGGGGGKGGAGSEGGAGGPAGTPSAGT
jgi:hypothetical protein